MNQLRSRGKAVQKSVQRPLYSQSPKRVGSGPFGPPISLGDGTGEDTATEESGVHGASVGGVCSSMTKMWQRSERSQPLPRLPISVAADRNHILAETFVTSTSTFGLDIGPHRPH